MTQLAAHLNDAAITVVDGSGIRYREPGFALLDADSLTTGTAAFREARIHPRRIQHRYWSTLTVDALADQRFSHLSAADLVSRQLEQIVQTVGSTQILVAVPATMSAQNLGLFLGVAAETGFQVGAMVDAAVAATRREYAGAVPVHIDISLHATMLSRLAQPGRVQLEKSEVLDGCGTYALFDAWLKVIAEAFVQQSRFDPLHTAETEQMLVDRLGRWLAAAASSDAVPMQIEYNGTEYEATVESLQMIAAASPIYQAIASTLRSLYRADDVPALQITDRAARLPGLADTLQARVGGEIYVLEPGATARGALGRLQDATAEGGSIALQKQLPWDQASVAAPTAETSTGNGGVPTHILFGDTAWAIGGSALTIGSEQSNDGRLMLLDSEMPGVSRRHCAVRAVKGQAVIEDFSRYGTFLNGHRIDGTAVLQVGDSVQVGTPGYEFRLITTDEQHG